MYIRRRKETTKSDYKGFNLRRDIISIFSSDLMISLLRLKYLKSDLVVSFLLRIKVPNNTFVELFLLVSLPKNYF